MPAPPEVVDRVAASSTEQWAKSQDDLAYLVALIWFTYGGLDDAAALRWVEAARPALAAARANSAFRGWEYANLLYSLQTDSAFRRPTVNILDAEEFRALEERAERYLRAPVTRARWEVALLRDTDRTPEVDANVRPQVARAAAAARQQGILVPPSAEVSDYAAAMERGTARAVEQALGDANSGFGIGVDQFSSATKVKRYLKVPHAGACDRCILVSGRGYRTAQAAMNAGHVACKCGTKAVYAPETDSGGRRARVRNIDWRQTLIDQGYGALVDGTFAGASAAGREALLGELFP